ncbi:MAG: PAS domain S-box protein, partial [Pseudomonadota bacterium]
MTETLLIGICVVLLLASICFGWLLLIARNENKKRLKQLNTQLLAVAQEASVGHRLADDATPEAPELTVTLNQLFDALQERDLQIGEREKLFRQFALTIPEVVLVHDQRIYFANDAAAGLIGLPAAQLGGRSVTDIVKPAYRAIFRKGTQNLLDEELSVEERELQLINGEEQGLWVEARSHLIDYEGRSAVLTIARDITHRRSLEASLGRGKQFAQFTLESIAEGVITTDTGGRIDYMNRAA